MGPGPSHASCINDIVLSILLLLVLGLVIVVPRLAARPCPRLLLRGDETDEVGDIGVDGGDAIRLSATLSAIPFGGSVSPASLAGDPGCDDEMIAFPSSE